MMGFLLIVLALTLPILRLSHPNSHSLLHSLGKCVVTLDHTCSNHNGYTCDPSSLNGGGCCPGAGYCGNTGAHCGSGCQPAYSSGGCFGRSTLASPAMPTILYRIVGTFTHQALWDFTSLTSLPTGLIASDYTINDMAGNPSTKYNHVF